MSNINFVGRLAELDKLKALSDKKSPGLVVVKGRRRIGKSRLIAEFASQYPSSFFWSFAGLAPEEGVSAQTQRDHFARQLSQMQKIPPLTFLDWSDAFEHLSLYLKSGDIVLMDEISWMGSKDPTFIPKLKAWWDKQTLAMTLVFCGSVSTWIEDNIIKSTAFFGRIHLCIDLDPLSIQESALLLKNIGMHLSHYDAYKILSILGGVPWYLEQLNPKLTADENIQWLAFDKAGLLLGEFDRIFHDLSNGRGGVYKKILDSLRNGPLSLAEIRQAIEFSKSGTLSEMMNNLITAGFVTQQPLWSFKSAKLAKQSLYRILDPYMRFYLKLIEPNLDVIRLGDLRQVPLSTLPGWEAHIGLQVEALLLQNRSLIHKSLGISPVDILRSGPYRQTQTSTQKGCQIDYLIQTKTNTLYICEFKFKRSEIGADILNELQEKMTKLKVPKGFAKVAVMFHLSGVSESVEMSGFFYRIIDIAEFLGPFKK